MDVLLSCLLCFLLFILRHIQTYYSIIFSAQQGHGTGPISSTNAHRDLSESKMLEKPKPSSSSSSSKPPRVKNYSYPVVTPRITKQVVHVYAPCVMIKEEAKDSEIEAAVNKIVEDAKLCHQVCKRLSSTSEHGHKINQIPTMSINQNKHNNTNTELHDTFEKPKPSSSSSKPPRVKNSYPVVTPPITRQVVHVNAPSVMIKEEEAKDSEIEAVNRIVEEAKVLGAVGRKDKFEKPKPSSSSSSKSPRVKNYSYPVVTPPITRVKNSYPVTPPKVDIFSREEEFRRLAQVVKNVGDIQGPAKAIVVARLMSHGQTHSMANNPMPAAAAHSLFDLKKKVMKKIGDIQTPHGHKINQMGRVNQNKHKTNTNLASKELLKVMDKVEKMYLQELNEYKRSPTAKKAEREKRVKILMSMR